MIQSKMATELPPGEAIADTSIVIVDGRPGEKTTIMEAKAPARKD